MYLLRGAREKILGGRRLFCPKNSLQSGPGAWAFTSKMLFPIFRVTRLLQNLAVKKLKKLASLQITRRRPYL